MNTGFFHKVVNIRRRINTIHTLSSADGILIGGTNMQLYIRQHFKRLFGQTTTNRIEMTCEQWHPSVDLRKLERDFTQDEIKKAVWDLGPDKASGPDRFPLFFYRIFWEEVKGDVLALISDFTEGRANIKRINYSFITLIPKKDSLEVVGDYKSIALLNISLKIISKLLANRLATILPHQVDETVWLHTGEKYFRWNCLSK